MINNKNRILGKKKCACGRRIIVPCKDGRLPYDLLTCSTCKNYGVEESKRMFAELDAETRKKSMKTEFKIKGGKYEWPK